MSNNRLVYFSDTLNDYLYLDLLIYDKKNKEEGIITSINSYNTTDICIKITLLQSKRKFMYMDSQLKNIVIKK